MLDQALSVLACIGWVAAGLAVAVILLQCVASLEDGGAP